MGRKLDARADLFSLGSVLYQMACGRPPFRASSAMAVLRRVVDGTPCPMQEIIPEIPDWSTTIIKRLLAKNSDDRFQTSKEVADLFARCQSELQLTGVVTCIPPQSTPHAPREVAAPAAPDAALIDPQPHQVSSAVTTAEPAPQKRAAGTWNRRWTAICGMIATAIVITAVIVNQNTLISPMDSAPLEFVPRNASAALPTQNATKSVAPPHDTRQEQSASNDQDSGTILATERSAIEDEKHRDLRS